MANISFVAAGTAVATATTSLALVAPAVLVDDILIVQIVSKNNDAVVYPTTDWTVIRDVANTAAMQTAIAWKRVVTGDSGATFTFTVGGTTISFGILTAYRGAIPWGSPIGKSTSSVNALADDVTYATLTPNSNKGAIVACGSYALSATTAGAMDGTDPTFVNVVDEETGEGTTASLFQYWGSSSGAATGARVHSTTSTVDALNQGFLFDLMPISESSGGGTGGAKYPRVVRTRKNEEFSR